MKNLKLAQHYSIDTANAPIRQILEKILGTTATAESPSVDPVNWEHVV